MAKFVGALPTDLVMQFSKLEGVTQQMFEDMTQAGAEVVLQNVRSRIPDGLRDAITEKNIVITKPYTTPSDGGVNTQIMIVDYFYNRYGIKTPAPLVANMYEYGSSSREKYPRKRFFRACFNRKQIETAMLEVQEKYLNGELPK